MTTWKRRARLGVFALLSTITLTGTLAACGDGDSTTDAGASEGTDSSDAGASPLDEFLGDSPFGSAGGGFAQSIRIGGPADDESRQKARQVEDEIAACMEAEGFEYVPHVPDEDAGAAFDEANELSPDDYARQYGYGISTMGALTGADEESEDPNSTIRDGLADAAKEAYDQALWGDMGDGMTVTEVEEGDENDNGGGAVVNESANEGELGCTQESHDKVFGPMEDRMVDFSEFDDLFTDLGALEERVTSDPEMAAAIDAWSDCMASAGYPDQDSMEAPQTAIMDRMSQLMGLPGAGGSGGDATMPDGGDVASSPEEDAGSSEGEEGQGVVARPVDPAEIDEQALEDLRDDEIATAVADRECRDEHVDAVEEDVRGAMEQEFVDANRDVLERYRDSMAGEAR